VSPPSEPPELAWTAEARLDQFKDRYLGGANSTSLEVKVHPPPHGEFLFLVPALGPVGGAGKASAWGSLNGSGSSVPLGVDGNFNVSVWSDKSVSCDLARATTDVVKETWGDLISGRTALAEEDKQRISPRIFATGTGLMKWEVADPNTGKITARGLTAPLLTGYQTKVPNSAHQTEGGSSQDHCVLFVENVKFPGLECRHIMVQNRQDDNAAGSPTGGM
jgi:hypothetical protein